jgi:hypothetical protein
MQVWLTVPTGIGARERTATAMGSSALPLMRFGEAGTAVSLRQCSQHE